MIHCSLPLSLAVDGAFQMVMEVEFLQLPREVHPLLSFHGSEGGDVGDDAPQGVIQADGARGAIQGELQVLHPALGHQMVHLPSVSRPLLTSDESSEGGVIHGPSIRAGKTLNAET